MDEVEEYWKRKEEELNEKIIEKFLCRYLRGYRNFATPTWGLMYYTERALYFESVPRTKNWFENMITKTNSIYTQKEDKFRVRATWEEIESLELSPKESWFKRTFLSSDRKLELKTCSENITLIVNDEVESLINFYETIKKQKLS